MLEIKNVYKTFNAGTVNEKVALKGLDLTLEDGDFVTVIGGNGAGKSTLAKLICGFETPDSGEIFFDGKDLKDENIRRRARHIGYVMQNPNQMISKTMIFDEVALGLQGSGLTDAEIRARARGHAEGLRLVPVPQLAHLGAELRPEKARDHRQRAGAEPRAYHSGRADGGPGFPTLHRHYGVPARAERQGCDRGHDQPTTCT